MVERPPRLMRNPFNPPNHWFDGSWNEDSDLRLGNRMYAPPFGPRPCSQVPLGLSSYVAPLGVPKPVTQSSWWEEDPAPQTGKYPWCNFFVKERKHLSYSNHRVPKSLNRSIFQDSSRRLKGGRSYHLWGTLVMINFLAYLYQLWVAEPRQGSLRSILLGDISLYGGGKTSAHVSHTAGTEVDLYYLRTDGINQRYVWEPDKTNLAFDYESNVALLRVIYKAGQNFAQTVHPDLARRYQRTLGRQIGKFALRYVYTDVERLLKDTRFKAEIDGKRLKGSNPQHGHPKHLDHFHVTIT